MAAEKQAAAAAEAITLDGAGLLDQVLGATNYKNDKQKEDNKRFVEAIINQALTAAPGTVVAGDIERTIQAWKAQIDQKMSVQVSAILHHPEFQRLEGTWRGLKYLIDQSETGESLKIKVLNITKKSLAKDLEKAVEFDQSTLFKKVYESEFGQLGGKPYGMLVGDYDFDGKSAEDVGMLKSLGGIAGAAHAPFIASAGCDMFNLKDMTELNNPRDLAKVFDSAEYAPWKSFRESEDSRYVALTMPRVLGRLPYGSSPAEKKIEEFNYEEGVDGTDHNKYLWMNSAWAYAARCTDAFAKDGWFMRTRGVEGGGKVEGLPLHVFQQAGGKVAKCPTEVLIPDRRENELSELGFLPLLHYKDSDKAVFIGTQSCQKPKKYFEHAASANAELSTKLNYMMCVSRFAHYLKVMARDKVGSMMERNDIESWLNDWINNYVTSDPSTAGEETKAKRPLQAAQVSVQEVKGKPGWYQAVAHLRPHFQLEGITASMRLVAELPQKKA